MTVVSGGRRYNDVDIRNNRYPPTGQSAERTILTPTVAPGGTVDVTLLANGDLYGAIGAIVETLPAGFSWVAFIPVDFEGTLRLDPDDSQLFQIVLLGNVTEPIPYQLLVDSAITPGIYNLTGVIDDEDKNPFTIVGDTEITVAFPPSVAVSTTDLTVNEGSTGTYTVKLNTQPSDEVTVTIVDPTDNTDVTASPASLTFLHYGLGYRADGHRNGGRGQRPLGGHGHRDAHRGRRGLRLRNRARRRRHRHGQRHAWRNRLAHIPDGRRGQQHRYTYTVELNTLPTGNVTVAISSNNTDVTVSSTRLTFTTTRTGILGADGHGHGGRGRRCSGRYGHGDARPERRGLQLGG